jgi:hypothetical protein
VDLKNKIKKKLVDLVNFKDCIVERVLLVDLKNKIKKKS